MGKRKKIEFDYETRKRMLCQTMKDIRRRGQSLFKGRLSVQEFKPHWEQVPSDFFGADDAWNYHPAFNINELRWRLWFGFIPYYRRHRLLTVLIGFGQDRQVYAYLFDRSLKSVALAALEKYAKAVDASRVELNHIV